MAVLKFDASKVRPAGWYERGASATLSPDPRAEVVSIETHTRPAGFGLQWIGDTPLAMPKWLVKGLLPETGVALLAGQYSAGKTFIALDLSLSVAMGVPFLKRKTASGGVFWIAAEGGGEIEPRIEAARRAKFNGRANYYGAPIPLTWTEAAPPLASDDGWRWLADAFAEADANMRQQFDVPIRLMPIDTLAAAFGLEDENDNAEAADLMRRLASFGKERGLLCMPITHLGKNVEAGSRGASAFGAGADAEIYVLANGDPLTGTVKSRSLVLRKLRRGSTGPLGKFELEPVSLGEDEDGDPVTSCAVKMAENSDDEPAPTARGGRGDQAFRDALNEALLNAGRQHRVAGSGPEVCAVDLQIVRNDFERRYVTGEPEGHKKSSAVRTAWKRAFDSALVTAQIGTEKADHIELIWKVH